ncbi:MAG: FAD-binding oxidoreductase [Nitrospirae bacterium]|nr:FAD-binding oxidoreductase [Candidatus Troglogloeales bacterium]MBI3598601.1 FAD-binding oxidoreductase [Candidatus Troglogloeales bacterium]
MPFSLKDLEATFDSRKVLTDTPAITAYSIDAGIYKVPPQAIVIIESSDDLEKALLYAREHRVPITARSGGTNVTGNAIGEGIILEFSRLNKILEVNKKERWGRVEPGIVYAELNRHLANDGLMFAPDPSSGDMCKIGGMLGNNAAGPHTLKYGATKENVLEMQILLTNGNWITAREYRMDEPALTKLLDANPFIKTFLDMIHENSALIVSKKRAVSKNSSGYNLFAIAEGLARNVVSLHQLFIGSEGTLGLTREAKILLHPRPTQVATGLIYLNRISDIGDAANDILALSPSALEMMDRNSLHLVSRQGFDIPKDAMALLLLEFDQDVSEQMDAARKRMSRYAMAAKMQIGFGAENQARLWKIRKAMYPTLYQYDLKKKPVNFADDVVVPAQEIPKLMAYLDSLFRDKGVAVAIYGHIGNGNAHINPLLDLNNASDFDKMVSLSHEIHETVINQFGGSICGEHGDGRVRAEFLPKLYGPELYDLFKKTKQLFDPDNILNPGVKISTVPFTMNVDFERLSKQCATCGKCNSVCPVYDVIGEESNSARGWFHVVTAPDYSYEKSSRVVEACINCKSCRVVCPAGIDVSEWVLKRREEHPNKMAKAVVAIAKQETLYAFLLKAAAWTQPLWDNKMGRVAIEYLTLPFLKGLAKTARIPADMILPRLARRHLRDRYPDLTESNPFPPDLPLKWRDKNSVAYFHGCAANYFDDGVGDAVIGVLKKMGHEVVLPLQRCSGTPIQTYGLIDRVHENAKFNIDSLERFEKVVTGCASCTFMLKDYSSILTEGEYYEKSRRLAAKVVHISEWAAHHPPLFQKPFDGKKKKVTYHSSCHLRAAGVHDAPRELLRSNPNLEFVEMPDADRCAGGAGTFCVKNPKLSEEIFERKRQGIQKSGAEIVATSCPACMIQLNNQLRGKVRVAHIAELL